MEFLFRSPHERQEQIAFTDLMLFYAILLERPGVGIGTWDALIVYTEVEDNIAWILIYSFWSSQPDMSIRNLVLFRRRVMLTNKAIKDLTKFFRANQIGR